MIRINDKFKPIITCPPEVRYTIVTGGRGSSKSYTLSTILTALTFDVGQKILYTRQTMQSAHISIIPEFLEKVELFGRENDFNINKTDIENILTKSSILFRGLQTSQGSNTANLKSIQGVNVWCCDEAEEIHESAFDKIDFSIREKGVHNRVILIMNPTTRESWIYKRFFEEAGVAENFNGIKGDTLYVNVDYRDNIENLSQSFLDNVAVMKQRRPEKYKHIILGAWLDRAEGVIFKNWTYGKFPNGMKTVYGQDFGFSVDPTVLVETYIDKKHKKIYIREHYGKTGMTTTDVFQMNQLVTKDGLIIGDSAEPRLIHEAKKMGCNIRPTKKGVGSVIAGLNYMLDYDLVIDPDSTELIKELNNYVWSDKKSKTPVDNWNHYIDAARYAISYQLENSNKGKYSIY